MVAASVVAKGLELQSFVHDDVPRVVCGDRMRVSQILANLVSNAVKFTAEGEVVVEVTLAARPDDALAVRFEVRDTGIGIAEGQIDDLFDAFAQADSATTREFGGTGLGLAISLELAQLMGGTIEADSELGNGSTFRLEIPFAPAHAQLPAPMAAVTGLHGLRVLVVDDNAANRRIFEAYAASWGMRPSAAGGAADAISELERAAQQGDPYEIALVDYNMPDESGLELATRVTASPALCDTRLILLTSSGQNTGDDPATGISYRLTKPVRQSRLLDAIRAVMAGDDHPEGRPARPEAAAPKPARVGRRVLVAEDQHVNWMLIERMLAKRGYSPVNASDGRRVLEMLASERYDLVLMDCQMPVLDGYDAARAIRRREAAEQCPRVPIVAMTANAMLGDRERCLEAGMDDYMPKPIRSSVLDEVLARWPLSTHDDVQGLDDARLTELRAVFPDGEMSGVLRTVNAEISAELDELGTASAQGDHAALARAAHRLKNSAVLVGATGLADAATTLEAHAGENHDGAQSGVAAALEELIEQSNATRAAIEATISAWLA
jgi:CheY-like chemotaxis protein